jgi:hypothetical protein
MDKPAEYEYCTKNWCISKPEDSIFGYLPGTQWADFFNCEAPYDNSTDKVILEPPAESEACCVDVTDPIKHNDCIEECSVADEDERTRQCVIDIEDGERLADVEKKCPNQVNLIPTPKPNTPPVTIPSVSPPVETPSVSPPVETPSVMPPVETPSVNPPVETPSVSQPVEVPVSPPVVAPTPVTRKLPTPGTITGGK